MEKRGVNLSILINRFLSLVVEYGYSIGLTILLSKISINHIIWLWLIKSLGSVAALEIEKRITMLHLNKKYVLLSTEIIKSIVLLFMPFFIGNYFLFVLVFLVEIMNGLFSSNLLSTIPYIIKKEDISKFSSSITFVGSISYFIAPMIVGIFTNFDLKILFTMYSLSLFLSSLFLLKLPNNIHEKNADENTKNEQVNSKEKIKISSILQGYPLLLLMLGILIPLESIATFFDAFEVVYITQILNFSDQFYSFSLSFLAIVFLLTSFGLSIVKIKSNILSFFSLGVLFYIGYLLVYVNSSTQLTILLSFLLLGIGQTIFGLMFNTYVMTEVRSDFQSTTFLYYSTIMKFASTAIVVVTGFLQNNIDLLFIYKVILYPTVLLSFLLLIRLNKKKNSL